MEYKIDARRIQLMKVEYDAFTEDELREPELDVVGDVEIVAEEDEALHVVWDLYLDFEPIMRARAVFMSIVYWDGAGSLIWTI